MAQAAGMDALADRGEPLPALGGVPLAVKDVMVTSGVRTTAGSKILQNFIPSYDCTAVARLEAAGAVFFFSSRRRHTSWNCDWSSDVCSSDLALSAARASIHGALGLIGPERAARAGDFSRLLDELERGIQQENPVLGESFDKLQSKIGRASCRERV